MSSSGAARNAATNAPPGAVGSNETAISTRPKTAPSDAAILALEVYLPCIFSVMLSGPALFVALPIAVKIGFAVLSLVTGGHVVMCVVATFSLTSYLRNMISQMAPSKRDADVALASSMVPLPLAILVLTSIVLRFGLWYTGVTVPSIQWFSIDDMLSKISFLVVCKVATGMLFLGMAVFTRYSGAFFRSVARCSTVPLAYSYTMPKDLKSMLLSLARPTPPASARRVNPGQNYHSIRPIQPQYVSSIVQLGVSAACGFLVAFGSVLPLTSVGVHGSSLYKADTIITCVLSVVIDTIASQLWDGRCHEIGYGRYSAPTFFRRTMGPWAKGVITSLFWRILFIPLLATFVTQFDSSAHYDVRSDGAMHTAITSMWTTAALTVYLQLVDVAVRVAVISTAGRTDLAKRASVEGGSMLSYLGICVYSILHSHQPSISFIAEETSQLSAETAMVKSSRTRETVAKFLLSGGREFSDTVPFEEDMLRLNILESFGGLGSSIDCFDATSNPMQHRHIQLWLCSAEKLNNEPVAMPLIRALCAYTGGVGRALSLASRDSLRAWYLPPGTIVALECALRAAGRFLIWKAAGSNGFSRQDTINRIMHSRINTLVPNVLNAAYWLHRGIEDHKNRCAADSKGTAGQYIDLIHPISRTCEDVARGLVKQTQQEMRLRLDRNALDRECSQWLEGQIVGM